MVIRASINQPGSQRVTINNNTIHAVLDYMFYALNNSEQLLLLLLTPTPNQPPQYPKGHFWGERVSVYEKLHQVL